MKNFNRGQTNRTFTLAALSVLGAALLTSCGASPYSEKPLTAATTATSSLTPPTSISTNPGAGGSTSGPSGGTSTSSNPTEDFSFTVTGSGGTTPSYSATVTTDNLLKVTVNAGASTNVIPGSNFSATYSCVTYQVTVLGQTMTTQTLSPNGGNALCPSAPASQTLDFSNRLTAGHQNVAVAVKATGYDFYCQGCLTYPWLYNAYPYGYYSCAMYCPLHTVYKNHGVTGTLSIEVNGS